MFMTQEQKEKYIASLYFSVKKDEVKKEDTFHIFLKIYKLISNKLLFRCQQHYLVLLYN